MKHWIPMLGEFEPSEETIIFKGKNVENNIGKEEMTCGLLLFDDRIFSETGCVSIDIEFESEELYTAEDAEIIINYKDQWNFACAGITGCAYKYEAKFYQQAQEGRWNCYRVAGLFQKLIKRKLNLRIEIEPEVTKMYIDGIEVMQMPTISENKTYVGLWCRSSRTIRFSNYKSDFSKRDVFVISQFGETNDQIYNSVIREMCVKKGLEVTRADEISGSTQILGDIIRYLKRANIVIADITANNPNVFYELGYAHALGKEVILLCERKETERLPFDISGYRTIFFNNTISGKDEIEEKISRYIDEILKKQGLLK